MLDVRKETVLLLEGDMTEEEAKSMVEGDCPHCNSKQSVALCLSDDFTGFFRCWECKLIVHQEVLQLFAGEPVQTAAEAFIGLFEGLKDTTPKGDIP